MNHAGGNSDMETIDTEAAADTVEDLQHNECERLLAAFDDERHAQEWRLWRASEFRRHRRIDRIGDVVAAILSALILYAALHARHGH
jgi:hypothetical protein